MHFTLIRQNWTHALRRELGYPDGTPLLHTLAFATGPLLDNAFGEEVARVAVDMGRDVVISSWGGIDDDAPQEIGLALREADGVRWIAPCHLWARDAHAPLAIVPLTGDHHYTLGPRGWIEKRAGCPARPEAGRRRAAARIARTAAMLGDVLQGDNRLVVRGTTWADSLTYAQIGLTGAA